VKLFISPERATEAAKALKRNLDDWGFVRPHNWHLDTVAEMVGHSSWREHETARKTGGVIAPSDDTIEFESLAARQASQTNALATRLENAGCSLFADKNHLKSVAAAIAKHVAVTGKGSSGLAFQTVTVELNEDGIDLPVGPETHAEDAFFRMIYPEPEQFRDRARHAGLRCPAPDAIEKRMGRLRPESSVEQFLAAYEMANRVAKDSFDARAMMVVLGADAGQWEAALTVAFDGIEDGIAAWAPEARERRRRHDRVRWWEEPATRPYLRFLYWCAFVLADDPDEERCNYGLRLAHVVGFLTPDDPLKVRHLIESRFGVPVLD
jgi:hypothetical protein